MAGYHHLVPSPKEAWLQFASTNDRPPKHFSEPRTPRTGHRRLAGGLALRSAGRGTGGTLAGSRPRGAGPIRRGAELVAHAHPRVPRFFFYQTRGRGVAGAAEGAGRPAPRPPRLWRTRAPAPHRAAGKAIGRGARARAPAEPIWSRLLGAGDWPARILWAGARWHDRRLHGLQRRRADKMAQAHF